MTATRIKSVLDDVLAVAAATFIRTALPDALLILAGVLFCAMHVVPLGMACFWQLLWWLSSSQADSPPAFSESLDEAQHARLLALGVTEIDPKVVEFFEPLGYRQRGMHILWLPGPRKQIIILGIEGAIIQ